MIPRYRLTPIKNDILIEIERVEGDKIILRTFNNRYVDKILLCEGQKFKFYVDELNDHTHRSDTKEVGAEEW